MLRSSDIPQTTERSKLGRRGPSALAVVPGSVGTRARIDPRWFVFIPVSPVARNQMSFDRVLSRTIATCVVPLVLALPAGAAAAPPWSAPVSVGPRGVEVSNVVVGRSGASLTYGYGSVPTLFPVSATGVPGRARRAPNVTAVGAYGNRAVFVRSETRNGREGVSFGDLGARSLGRLHPLTRGKEGAELLDVGPAGHVLVAAVTGEQGEDSFEAARSRNRLVWSAPGRRSRWPSLSLPGRATLLAAAIDRRGDGVLLLQRGTAAGDYVIAARTVRLRSGRVGPERRLDRTKLDLISGSVSVDDRGGAVLAWGMQDGGEEADRAYIVRAAFRRRTTTSFTPTVTLDGGGTAERPGGGPQAVMDGDGRATVAWTQAVGDLGGPTVPRAAVATRTTRFGAVADLLPQGYVSDAASVGDTTLVGVTGTTAPIDPSVAEAPPATVAGVVVRRGAAALSPVEPVASTTPGDPGGLSLGGGPNGFRAVWDGAKSPGKAALRWASRPAR